MPSLTLNCKIPKIAMRLGKNLVLKITTDRIRFQSLFLKFKESNEISKFKKEY